MYNFTTVYNSFKTLVGFEPTNNADIEQVNATNQITNSGLYYNDIDVSPHLTISKLYDCYDKEEYSSFNDFLTRFIRSNVQNACNEFISRKKGDKDVRALLEDVTLFEGVKKYTHTDKNKLFGWRIKPAPTEGIKTILKKISINLNGAQANLPVYLWHSSKQTAIKTTTIASIAANNFAWEFLNDWFCKYSDDSYKTGGVFYLGFFGSDLDSAVYPISTEMMGFNELKYNDVKPFTLDSTYHNGASLPRFGDAEENLSCDTTLSMGMSVNMIAELDLTDYFVRHREQFVQLLRYSAHVLAVEKYYASTENTPIKQKAEGQALFEISRTDKNSLYSKFQREIDTISFSFSDLNNIATPKKQRVYNGKI